MRHGGDLGEATRLYGEPAEGWLDLSTGVNPRPYPIADFDHLAAALARFPSAGKLDELIAAARSAYGVPDGVAVAPVPGTEILIRFLPRLADGGATIVDTSYASYRESFAAAGTETSTVADLDAIPADGRQSIVVVNPNNPDGRTFRPMQLLSLAGRLGPGQILFVDEAYAEAEPGVSVVPHLKRDQPVLALKSFGKFFGLPGLRLGFAIGPPALTDRLAACVGDWPVSGAAIAIGTKALSDMGWHGETRHWLGNMAQAVDSVLRSAGRKLEGGCRLFRIASDQDAAATHKKLARQGVWTRVFEDRPGLIRFGLPPDREGLDRLGDALRRL